MKLKFILTLIGFPLLIIVLMMLNSFLFLDYLEYLNVANGIAVLSVYIIVFLLASKNGFLFIRTKKLMPKDILFSLLTAFFLYGVFVFEKKIIWKTDLKQQGEKKKGMFLVLWTKA